MSDYKLVQVGSDIDGENYGDRFGLSVDLSSDGLIFAVGATYGNSNGDKTGYARVYEYSKTARNWSKIGDDLVGEAQDDHFGHDVSLSADGKIVASGGRRNDGSASNAGNVMVFEYSNNSWSQLGNDIDGEAENDYSSNEYGISLSSNGKVIAIGGPFNDGNGTNSGHVRVYRFVSNGWSQVGSDLDGEQEFDSFYATNLSPDGTTLAVAAPNNDDSANNAGHVKTYSLISESSPNPVDIFSSTIKNTATNISLVSSDSDYDNLTYSITGTSANPAYGSVNLDGSIATYTPNTGFEGNMTTENDTGGINKMSNRIYFIFKESLIIGFNIFTR